MPVGILISILLVFFAEFELKTC